MKYILLAISVSSFLKTLSETNDHPFSEKTREWAIATAISVFLTAFLFSI